MNENHPSGERKDFRRQRSANSTLSFRVLAIFAILYFLYEIVAGYVAGGPDAPSLTLLLVAIALLGGGAVSIGVMAYREYKQAQEAAKMTQEEIEAMEALRAEEEE